MRSAPPGSRRTTWPGTRPSPWVAPPSSPFSASSCMPRQMPSTGRPAAAKSRTARVSPAPLRRLIAWANAPTPGSTQWLAPARCSGFDTSSKSYPQASIAFEIDRRLHMPMSMTATATSLACVKLAGRRPLHLVLALAADLDWAAILLAVPELEVPRLRSRRNLGERRLVRRDDRLHDDVVELGLADAQIVKEEVERRRPTALEVLHEPVGVGLLHAVAAYIERGHLRDAPVPALEELDVVAHALHRAFDLLEIPHALRHAFDLVALPAELLLDQLRLHARIPGDEGAQADASIAQPLELAHRRVLKRVEIARVELEVALDHPLHVLRGDAEVDVPVEAGLVDLLDLVVAVVVVRRVLARRLAPEHERHLVLQGHLHRVREDAGVAVPAEVTLAHQRLEHHAFHQVPVRREREHVDAELAERALVVA